MADGGLAQVLKEGTVERGQLRRRNQRASHLQGSLCEQTKQKTESVQEALFFFFLKSKTVPSDFKSKMDESKFLLIKKLFQTHSDSTSHFRCSEFSKDSLLELEGGCVRKTLAMETPGCEYGPQTQVKRWAQ